MKREATKSASTASKHLSRRESMAFVHPAVKFHEISRIGNADVSAMAQVLFKETLQHGRPKPCIPLAIKVFPSALSRLTLSLLTDHTVGTSSSRYAHANKRIIRSPLHRGTCFRRSRLLAYLWDPSGDCRRRC